MASSDVEIEKLAAEACDGAGRGSRRKCDPTFCQPPAKHRRRAPPIFLEPPAMSRKFLTPEPPDEPPPFRLWAPVNFQAMDLEKTNVPFCAGRFSAPQGTLRQFQLELFRFRWHAFASACVRMDLDERSQGVFFHGCWKELREWGPDGATELVQLMLSKGILQSK